MSAQRTSARGGMKPVYVAGRPYQVVQRPGYIKALLNNYKGWACVWAQDEIELKNRIRSARNG